MRNILRILAVLLLLNVLPVGISAAGPDTQAVLEKIAALGDAKAEIQHIRNVRVNGSDADFSGVDDYDAMKAAAREIRDGLAAMGAIPERDALAELPFDKPITVNGRRIRTFADFADAFGAEYDLFRIEYPLGEYRVCELIVMDGIGYENLSVGLSSDGRSGIELLPVKNKGSGSVPGQTQTYVVYAGIVPTVHFLYVRDAWGQWQYCLATGYADGLETHFWRNGLSSDGTGGETERDVQLTAESFENRAALAVGIFQDPGREESGLYLIHTASPLPEAEPAFEEIRTVQTEIVRIRRPSDLLKDGGVPGLPLYILAAAVLIAGAGILIWRRSKKA